jgi:hypothetical protein
MTTWIDTLASSARKVYSQTGEEGVLEAIFAAIGPARGCLVDIGAGDGISLSNTLFFLERGWYGARFDANYATDEEFTLYQERITAENICDVIGKYNVPREFDLLSLDIDGIDWWVLRSLLRVYSPRVFVCELNNSLSATDPLAVVYDPEFIWTPDDYFGASLGAYRMLAESRGYALVHCQPWNAFFVRRELLPQGVEPQVTWAPFRSWSPDPRRRPWHTIAAADLL